MENNKYKWINPPWYPLECDFGQDLIVYSPDMMQDKIISEELLNKFNSLGCTSFVLTSEQIKELMEHDDVRILEKMSRGEW